MAEIDRNAVSARAYALYVRRGKQPGHAIDDWLEAERQLRAEATGKGSAAHAPERTLVPGAPAPSGKPSPWIR